MDQSAHLARRAAAHLAVHAGLAVGKDDQLDRLVEEAVAAVAVPERAADLVCRDRRGVVQADGEDGRLDAFQRLLVGRGDLQQLLQRLRSPTNVVRRAGTLGEHTVLTTTQ